MGGSTKKYLPMDKIEESIGLKKAVFGSKGGKKKKSGGGGGGTYDPMMAFMAQMQANQAAQSKAAQEAQKKALSQSQQQSAMASARQGEAGAQQFLSQAGGMQQAKDIAALQAQQQSQQAAGASAVGGGYDIAKAQQEQAANLAGVGAIPSSTRLPFYGMDMQNDGVGATGRATNVFNLPKPTGVTFGGQ